jgi:hypothetical protein
MNLRKPLLVLSACAVAMIALSSFGVSAAAASTTEECRKEAVGEIFTSQHFSDENCTKKSGAEGLFHTTKLKPEAELTMKETKLPIVLETTLLGVSTVINCGSTMAKQTVSNYEEMGETGPAFGFKGEINGGLQLSSCSVSKPSGCTVNPIESVPLNVSSEDLPGEIQRTLFAPKEGTKFATLTISGCAISGSYVVEGKLRSQTVDIHTEEASASSGSELSIAKVPVTTFVTYHWVTEADGRKVVRELP